LIFQIGSKESDMQGKRVVVIGAGIVGASVADRR
jgi:phosphoglycerate dehydrogenase-like enzyme